MEKNDLKDLLYSYYMNDKDVSEEIVSLADEGIITLEDAYDALKDLYYSGKIKLKQSAADFEGSFIRGGRGNKVRIIYADAFELK